MRVPCASKPLSTLAGIAVGDQMQFTTGSIHTVTSVNGDAAHFDVPGQRYGHWLSISHPCVTGLEEWWPVAIIKPSSRQP